MPLADGQTFAGYRILRMLGSGGMGEVYLAQHPRLPRTDALKVLGTEVSGNAEYRARFAREADLASTLWHPHIVGVHDRGEDGGQLWISMDFVDGLDAGRLLADKFQNGMPAHQVSKIVTAVASALDHAHDRGLLHRDIKPANIMITNDEQRILLADFGIARSTADISSLTATGFTMGTVAYAAPEQLAGEELDGRADQYALAATAYHLLSGSHLFPHSNPAVVIGRHLNAAPPTLAETKRELAAVDPVLAAALAKNPDDRFPHCKDFARAFALARVEKGRGRATTPPAISRTTAAIAAQPTAPAALAEAPAIEAPRLVDSGSRRVNRASTLYKLLAVLGVAIPVAALVLWIRPWEHREPATATQAAPSIDFDNMRDFVEGYYADLPADTTNAWKKVDSKWQNETGHQDFLDFWATINSVTLVAVSPRDATSVIARVRYVPRGGQPSTEDRWLRMTLVNGTTLLDGSGRIGAVNESTTAAPTVGPLPASAINSLSPAPAEVSRVVNATALKVKSSSSGTTDNSGNITPATCVGVVLGAEQSVYANTGYVGLIDQALQPASYPYNTSSITTAPDSIEQTAVLFSTPEHAQALLVSSEAQWRACASSQVIYRVPDTNGEVAWEFNFGDVQLSDNVLAVSMMSTFSHVNGSIACQQVLAARANVVIGVRTCLTPNSPEFEPPPNPKLAGNSARQLAGDILSKVQS